MINRPTSRRYSAASRLRLGRKLAVPFVVATATALIAMGSPASAGIVATVTMGTSNQFSVLAGTTVTNTGPSVLNESIGLAPGSAVTGFPPGIVNLPASTYIADGVAGQGQVDLIAAYVDAATRPVEFTQATPTWSGSRSLQACTRPPPMARSA